MQVEQQRTRFKFGIKTGECVRTLAGHSGCVTSIDMISPTRLASGSMDGTIKIWNINNGECIRTLSGHSSAVISVKLISSGSFDKTIKIWNIDNGECIRTLAGHSD